ncbi:MAG: MATE family efflux transporter, partial [Myxococcota bacterium]|nr:MATE family efflux transporter [Myxococcota bacterium]
MTGPQPIEPSSPSTMRDSFRQLTELALPLVLVQASTHFAGFVDTVLIGRVGEVELGATGLGASVFLFTTITAMGICMGIDPIASQAFGATDPNRARGALWQGLYQALALALPVTGLYWLVGCYLEAFGVVPEVAHESQAYILGRLPAVLPFLLMTALRGYLQAARLTRAIVISSIASNVFNFIADWVLIYGDEGLVSLGLPAVGIEPMGVLGVGMASSMAAFIQLGIMSLGLRTAPK